MNKFTCAICGKEYDSIVGRSKCEVQCLADEKKKEEILKLKKEAEAREKSEKAAIDALDAAEETLKNYLKTYERLAINKNYPYLKLLFDRNTWWF